VKIVTGLCVGFVCSLVSAAEPERQPAANSAPAASCIYDGRVFSEGAVISVPPENRILLQCRLQTIELKGVQYTYLAWQLGKPSFPDDAKEPAKR
jgi:hypothetical protein